jgi:hypothetical protein
MTCLCGHPEGRHLHTNLGAVTQCYDCGCAEFVEKPAGAREAEFTCPGCGGTLFKVGEWQWHQRVYDAADDEWDSTTTDYPDDHTVEVHCDDCGRDCTALALAAGWAIEQATFTPVTKEVPS